MMDELPDKIKVHKNTQPPNYNGITEQSLGKDTPSPRYYNDKN